MRRLLNVLVALDRLVLCICTLGGFHPDATISAIAYRRERQGRLAGKILRPMIDALLYPAQKHHCRRAYFAARKRRR